ncbi:heme lyase NrfEFG subunit NrfE, partial [Klebsiella pneumoniae]|nr:heme lyase NrfEFG subunit NrfE [Klebsiella pneumoniae]
ARTGRAALVQSAQHAALGVFALVTACLLLLVYAFLTFDFSVRYVATNTNLGTPFYYRITAVWGALEGSIVLWAWMLSLYTLFVVLRHRRNAR